MTIRDKIDYILQDTIFIDELEIPHKQDFLTRAMEDEKWEAHHLIWLYEQEKGGKYEK